MQLKVKDVKHAEIKTNKNASMNKTMPLKCVRTRNLLVPYSYKKSICIQSISSIGLFLVSLSLGSNIHQTNTTKLFLLENKLKL